MSEGDDVAGIVIIVPNNAGGVYHAAGVSHVAPAVTVLVDHVCEGGGGGDADKVPDVELFRTEADVRKIPLNRNCYGGVELRGVDFLCLFKVPSG